MVNREANERIDTWASLPFLCLHQGYRLRSMMYGHDLRPVNLVRKQIRGRFRPAGLKRKDYPCLTGS